MPLQISGYKDIVSVHNGTAQIPDSPPKDVSINTFIGTYTVPDGVNFIKIKGTGAIQWTTDSDPEDFSGTEWRGVRFGQTFEVT